MSQLQRTARWAGPALLCLVLAPRLPADVKPENQVIPVAIVQFDTAPEKVSANLDAMERLARSAIQKGARWVVFHEGAACDYSDQLEKLAEEVPSGQATRGMERLAKELDCYLSFGLSEKDGDRFYITQLFIGPNGYFYRYQKTWLHKDPTDSDYRNEYARYDPGTGPELFTIDGIRATCFICADATAPRCIKRARALKPQVVFHPVNIVTRDGKKFREAEAAIAREIGAPLLFPIRVGEWVHKGGQGAAAIFSASGSLEAATNCDGNEEVILYRLVVPS
jgi:predicted amidohydrolase